MRTESKNAGSGFAAMSDFALVGSLSRRAPANQPVGCRAHAPERPISRNCALGLAGTERSFAAPGVAGRPGRRVQNESWPNGTHGAELCAALSKRHTSLAGVLPQFPLGMRSAHARVARRKPTLPCAELALPRSCLWWRNYTAGAIASRK